MARLPFCSWRRTPLNEITHTAYKEIALHLSWHKMSAEEAWYRVSSFIQCAKISAGLTCCASGTVAVKCPLETVFRSFFQPLLHLYCMLFAALPLFQSLFLQTLSHGTVHIVTCAKELQDIVLFVALSQLIY